MASRYWVGGTSNWNGGATTKWAATSGGAGGQPIPTSADDVFFDAASGAVTVSMISNIACKSLNCTGFTGTLTGAAAMPISGGGLTWGAAMTCSGYTGTITLSATSGSFSIVGNGVTSGSPLVFNGVGGSWTFSSASQYKTTGRITLTNATLLDFTGCTVTCDSFFSNVSNVRSLTITNSTWTVTGSGINTWRLQPTGLTFAGGGSALRFTDSTATTKQIVAGSFTYGQWTFGGSGSGQFDIFDSGNVLTGDLIVTNSGGALVHLTGDTLTMRNLDCSSFTGVLSANTDGKTYVINGDLIFAATMSCDPTVGARPRFTMAATSGLHTLAFAGVTITNRLTFDGVGGSWKFLSAPTVQRQTIVMNGSLDFNGFDLTTANFDSNNANTRSITMPNRTINLTGNDGSTILGLTWDTSVTTGLTLNASGATISVTDSTSSNKTLKFDSITFGTLSIDGTGTGFFIVSGNATYSLAVTNPANKVLQFEAGSTQHLTGFSATGTAGNLIRMESTVPGTPFSFSKPQNDVIGDYLDLSDSIATGGARWWAGKNSVNDGGNNGWRFSATTGLGPRSLR